VVQLINRWLLLGFIKFFTWFLLVKLAHKINLCNINLMTLFKLYQFRYMYEQFSENNA